MQEHGNPVLSIVFGIALSALGILGKAAASINAEEVLQTIIYAAIGGVIGWIVNRTLNRIKNLFFKHKTKNKNKDDED